MPATLTTMLVIIVILALIFDFINGFHDTANSIATSVSTRVLSPRVAIIMAAALNFAGALMSHQVAKTISSGIVSSGSVPEYIVVGALTAAIAWNILTWYFGIPSSSSHALIGGLIGSSVMYAMSWKVVLWDGVLNKIIIPLFSSPLIGFLLGWLLMNLLNFIFRRATPHLVNGIFSKVQILSAAFMAFTHGMNDAQKSMGIITFALIGAGMLPHGANVPVWVMLLCATAMALGTATGGWKIIKTMGVNMIHLKPINGAAAETGAAIVISVASQLGMPVSTTHVISTSIMGVGAARRLKAVRWALARNIVWAWIITIPVTMILGAAVTLILKLILGTGPS